MDSNIPKVSLVGAGPGHPGLITVLGLDLLRQAEVVVYDALVDRTLLDQAPPDALLIDVGKRAGRHTLTQDQINQVLVDHARQGKRVVRLKGGDPFLFGRGAEEAAFLNQHGICCQVIPGITSGLAAPAFAGIPVTHRQIASTVTLVTGHETPDKPESALDFAALARLIQAGGTVCFYMGVGRLTAITGALQDQGVSAETPAALVQWGTTPMQRSVRATLHDLPAQVEAAGLSSPAIIVVGAVAGLAEIGLDHWSQRPLLNQRILVTRTRQQASELRVILSQMGALVIEAPTIELIPPADEELSRVNQALTHLGQYDWLLLTSVNAVEALAQRLNALGLDARHLATVKLAVIGQATAAALKNQLAIQADLVPPQAVAESLAGQWLAQAEIKNSRVLMLRADIARPTLPDLLAQAGAQVTDLAIYHTRRPASLAPQALEALRQGQIDWITFTSSSTARNLMDMLGAERSLLAQVKRASIGPITSQTLQELGLPSTVEASSADVHSLAHAIANYAAR